MNNNYYEYIQSEEWKQTKKTLYKLYHKPRCYCCGYYTEAENKAGTPFKIRRRIHVHHITYERLGEELIEDLILLCSRCHKAVHRLVKNNEEVGLKNAHIIYKIHRIKKRRYYEEEI